MANGGPEQNLYEKLKKSSNEIDMDRGALRPPVKTKPDNKSRQWTGEVDGQQYSFQTTGDRKPSPSEMRTWVKQGKAKKVSPP